MNWKKMTTQVRVEVQGVGSWYYRTLREALQETRRKGFGASLWVGDEWLGTWCPVGGTRLR